VNEISMEQNVRVVRDFSYNDLNQLVEFNEKEVLNVATHYQYSYDNFENRISRQNRFGK